MAGDDFPAPAKGWCSPTSSSPRTLPAPATSMSACSAAGSCWTASRRSSSWPTGWVIINIGGRPTDDKPDVILEPPRDPTRASAFLNIRVADIQTAYQEWRSKGAVFLTPPKDHGREIRCYMRDPDGHLIEVGQTTG